MNHLKRLEKSRVVLGFPISSWNSWRISKHLMIISQVFFSPFAIIIIFQCDEYFKKAV